VKKEEEAEEEDSMQEW